MMNLQGRLVKMMSTQSLKTISFGEDLNHGVYMVEVIRGINKKTIRLVKE